MIKANAALLEQLRARGITAAGPKKNKYGAIKTKVDDITFASKAESRRYELNKLRIADGELLYQLLQVPFILPGGIRYLVDFIEFAADGSVKYVDVKGKVTAQFKDKKRLVEALYPVEIVCVKLTNYERMAFQRVDV